MTEDSTYRSVKRISAFSVILIMVVLMVIGGAMIPLLKVQYTPSDKRTGFTVSFGYPNASARVVEQEVTRKIEGMLNSIDGIVDIRANSWKGGGEVALFFKKNANMDAARFEAATQIRQLYSKLPAGVSYPYINMSLRGSSRRIMMTYTINADLPPDLIARYAEEQLFPALSRIEGVEEVSLSGANPFEWVITFDPNLIKTAGISPDEISAAFNTFFRADIVGNYADEGELHTIKLRNAGGTDLENIPIKIVKGRKYYLRDIARIQYREKLPDSYFRINGLNTIYMNFWANEGINTIDVARKIRETITMLEPTLPENYSLYLTSDASVPLKKELDTILFRSVLSLLILLAFVFVVSRSLRYLFIITLTILVNLLIAVIFYYWLGLEIQLYSLAGITVSLGIIIDTSIVMIDHFSYYRDKRVFTSILGALLTTIAALLIVFFLPEQQKANLIDFVWVIIINLTVSVAIAFLFIPSLLEKLPIKRKGIVRTRTTGKRRLVNFTHRYERFILWGRRHKWLFILVLIFGFGLPLHLLPEKVGREDNADKLFVRLYNNTIGSTWYLKNKKKLETVFGGSFRYFSENYRADQVFRQPEPRKSIDISASMPEGCTVHQLNEVMRSMENYLSQYDEIDMYQTRVSSYSSGHIHVTFKNEYENTDFPFRLREEIVNQAICYGGARWGVYGIVEQGFSNFIGSDGRKDQGIKLTGYNYDMLYRYAEMLVDSLSKNRRVSEIGIFSDERYALPINEYYIRFNSERITCKGLNLNQYYDYLQNQLYNNNIGLAFDGQKQVSVFMQSSEKSTFDLWHIQNDMVTVDTIKTRLKDVGVIVKRRSGNNIVRHNQEYQLVVGFSVIGPPELGNRILESSCAMMNNDILPMGYKVHRMSRGYWMTSQDNWRQTGLLLLVIIVIYSLCAVIFESLRKPFVILLLIPVGFIGLFLTFAIGEFTFDQGGYAAMIMMCGIVVNAGIYIINEYNIIRSRSSRSDIVIYVKAYNRKIIPTLLTVVSTVLGLIPFLFDGSDSVFWFAFAVGVMGAMLFSIIALVVYLPVFLPIKRV